MANLLGEKILCDDCGAENYFCETLHVSYERTKGSF